MKAIISGLSTKLRCCDAIKALRDNQGILFVIKDSPYKDVVCIATQHSIIGVKPDGDAISWSGRLNLPDFEIEILSSPVTFHP